MIAYPLPFLSVGFLAASQKMRHFYARCPNAESIEFGTSGRVFYCYPLFYLSVLQGNFANDGMHRRRKNVQVTGK